MSSERSTAGLDFIRTIVEEDMRTNRWDGRVVTRFPPEPNGYLHLGHAKALSIDFGIARDYGGRCHLRMDDTNPANESMDFVEAIQRDIRWLGYDWGEHLHFAADYFEQMYAWAVQLIEAGKAYVCDLSNEEFSRNHRGTITRAGKNSPYRERSVEENVDLFARMRAGEFDEGACVLRAKIDMSHVNMLMRDPAMYRVLKQSHYRTGDAWCIYPTYDWAHGLEDSIETVTHSLCSLEFEVHRPLYDWFLDQLGIYHPQQTEFANLNVTHMVLSKRRFAALIDEGHVAGYDDPRMPTLAGLRRRGYTPEGINDFCSRIGVAKADSLNEIAQLEHCLREDLNKRAPRVMGVLDPLRVVIVNYPDDQVEDMDAVNNPEDPDAGTRKVPFSKILCIEREDFMEDPPRKFYRLAPGREVRLRYAYFIKCEEVIKDENGEVVELRCTYDPHTRGGNNPPDGRKVKATLHWVAAEQALEVEARLYDYLFTKPDMGNLGEDEDWRDFINPDSLTTVAKCYIEPSVADAQPGVHYQFERKGYFVVDPDSTKDKLVFNRTVTLRDSWARIQKRS